MSRRRAPTTTSAFGVGRREGHDASAFYARFTAPVLSTDDTVTGPPVLDDPCRHGDARSMSDLADNSIALVVTSPPYFVGKEYEQAVAGSAAETANDGAPREVPGSYAEYLTLLHDVFAECVRVLEPGGRIAVNVANLGRKPYRSLAADVVAIYEQLGLLLRGEIIWQKARSTSGSCAWGSFASPANPVLRDTTERVLVAAKGRFDRALPAAERERRGLPHQATISNDEFLAATLDVWEIPAESARRVNHPAPFPVELPRRLIELYTYAGDAVLDPFMGSGSTLVAAVEAGRAPVGYDLDPDYVDRARTRVADARAVADKADNGVDNGVDISADGGRANGAGPVNGAGPGLEPDGVDETDAPVGRGETAGGRAERLLAEAGFTVERRNPTLRGTGATVSFAVSAPSGARFHVEVPGGFTIGRPGLVSTEAVWRVLGLAHVVAATAGRADHRPLLVLAPGLPRAGSPADKVLRAVGADPTFDVIDLTVEHAARRRLAAYAEAGPEPDGRGFRPRGGFWVPEAAGQN